MNRVRFSRPLILMTLVIGLAMAGYMLRATQKSQEPLAAPTPVAAEDEGSSGPSDKIIVSDQAQKNLGLTAKSLQAEVFWKTVTIQGMVVDRPGFSDREIVAPAVGTVVEFYHVPGDMVHPGDKLFKLKLASESLQQTQSELYKTSENIKLAEARRERLASGGQAIAQAQRRLIVKSC
jgi:membrane fusion protein, heavy metal efflux system